MSELKLSQAEWEVLQRRSVAVGAAQAAVEEMRQRLAVEQSALRDAVILALDRHEVKLDADLVNFRLEQRGQDRLLIVTAPETPASPSAG